MARFPIHPVYSGLVAAWYNDDLVADRAVPQFDVAGSSFKIRSRNKGEMFAIPDVLVGDRGKVKRYEFIGTETTKSTIAYGLETVIPFDDVENSKNIPGYDIVADNVEGVANWLALARESRVATLLFTAANYASGLKATLSGTTQWSDDTSDIVGNFLDALDAVVGPRPNKVLIGQAAWTKARRHPALLKSWHANEGDSGAIPGSFLEELLELPGGSFMKGSAFYTSTAEKTDKTSTQARLFGKHCAIYYSDPQAARQGRTTFVATARWGKPLAGFREDPDAGGIEGGIIVRAGHRVAEVQADQTVGYFYENCVA